jgi:hypothetical protein
MGDNEEMICEACRERRHGECRGGTWCDCQHRQPAGPPPWREDDSGERPASDEQDERDEQDAQGEGPEPRVNWLRQG